MKSELAEEIFQLIETRSDARPTPMEFEMAYQARVASTASDSPSSMLNSLGRTRNKCEKPACSCWTHSRD